MKKLLLLSLFVLAPLSMATADLKVAVVDLSKTFDGYYKTKDAQAKLKTKQDGYQKEIQGYISDYQHMGEEAQALDKGAQDPTLSAPARQDKTTALNQKKQDLMNLQNKIQEMKTERSRELTEEMGRVHNIIIGEITKTITDYSTAQGFDVVIDKSPSAGTGVPILLYASPKLTDITPDIVAALNKTAPAPGGAAPAPAAASAAK